MRGDSNPSNGLFPRDSLILVLSLAAVAGCTELPTSSAPRAADVVQPEAPVFDLKGLKLPALRSCRNGTLVTGALYRICTPLVWNGSVVLWAPGYAAPHEPLAIRDSEIEGRTVSEIVNALGFAFATTSFHTNGLVPNGVADLVALVDEFRNGVRRPVRRVYAVGASHGGLVATRALEQAPSSFSGGLAMCAPIGDFAAQMNWIGDMRVIFDVLFKPVLDPLLAPAGFAWPVWSALVPQNPPDLIANWNTIQSMIAVALAANPALTAALLSVTGAPIDPANVQESVGLTVLGLLWYHVFGTNDALAKLGGNPFHNADRMYSGSPNDALLNAAVQRFVAAPVALATVAATFSTTGALPRPLVTLHTTADPIVPFQHTALYGAKVQAAGAQSQLVQIPVNRYGHCTFTITEVLAAFAVLVLRTA